MRRITCWLLPLVLALPAQAQTALPAPLPAPAELRRVRAAHDCLVEPFMVVQVGSPVDGVVEEVTVDRGDFVKKGQVVARLEALAAS